LVLSRDASFEPTGAIVCESFDEAVQIAREQAVEDGVEEYCAIGGTAVFEAALAKAHRVYLSEVAADVTGDAYFPAFNENGWTEVRCEHHDVSEGDQYPFTFRVLER
jgi:dihydrofolate reductase